MHDGKLTDQLQVSGNNMSNGVFVLEGDDSGLVLRSDDGQRVEFSKLMTRIGDEWLFL